MVLETSHFAHERFSLWFGGLWKEIKNFEFSDELRSKFKFSRKCSYEVYEWNTADGVGPTLARPPSSVVVTFKLSNLYMSNVKFLRKFTPV